MTVTKNPDWFIWARAAARLAFKHKAFVGGAAAALLLLLVVSIASRPSQTTYVPVQQQATAPAKAENTSAACQGVVRVVELTEADVAFNPSGCYFYLRVVRGRIELSGHFAGTVEVGPETSPFIQQTVTTVRAKTGTGSAVWQYVLCSGKKQNMDSWDCS